MPMLDPDAMLKNPENGKVTVISRPPEGSLASISSYTQIEAEIEKGDTIKAEAAADPAYRSMLNTQEMHLMQDPRGRNDPRLKISTMFAVGDIVYHRKYKEEAKVKQVGADGRIQVKWRSGEKSWIKPENLVKL